MEPASPATRFADLSRLQALAVLALTMSALGWCLKTSLTEDTLPTSRTDAMLVNGEVSPAARAALGVLGASTVASGASPAGEGPLAAVAVLLSAERETDWVFYRNIVRRVHEGEVYYDAVEREFQRPKWSQGVFSPTSIFNWRTPIYAWLFGCLPDPVWGQVLLALLAVATSLLAFALVSRELGIGFAPLTLLLSGPFALCAIGEIFYFTELWAGTLIALSICACAFGRWPIGVTAALAGLFLRELVLPYCLLALVLAVWQRRRAEAAAWLAGLALFGLFYAWHVQEVTHRITPLAGGGPGGVVQAANWIRFGGTAFVLGTTELNNVFLVYLPPWVSALFLPLSLLGLAGWRGETGLRAFLTAAGYLAAFAVAGQPYNAYWGLLIAPLLALGFIWMPAAMWDLGLAIVNRGHSCAEKEEKIQ